MADFRILVPRQKCQLFLVHGKPSFRQALLKLQAEEVANIHSLQNLSGAVKLPTNNKRHPSLVFQFRAAVVPPFEVMLATIVLTNHSKEQRLR